MNAVPLRNQNHREHTQDVLLDQYHESAKITKVSPTSVITFGAMKMPIIGLGTWQASDDETEKAVDQALSAGYRHIDTAYFYRNEKGIGKALDKWLSSGKIKREDLFVVTKLPASHNSAELVEEVLTEQLQSLCLDYVDLYIIHLPMKFKLDPKDLAPKNIDGETIWEPTDHISTWKIFDFELSEQDMKTLQSLDKGPAGRGFNFLFFPGIEKDPNFPFNIPY